LKWLFESGKPKNQKRKTTSGTDDRRESQTVEKWKPHFCLSANLSVRLVPPKPGDGGSASGKAESNPIKAGRTGSQQVAVI
jgi:hypothetical protein